MKLWLLAGLEGSSLDSLWYGSLDRYWTREAQQQMNARHRIDCLLAVTVILSITGAAYADVVVKNPASGTPEAALVSAFEAAQARDFSKYLKVIHSEHKDTQRQRDERQKYEWARFLTQYQWYLLSKHPVSYAVASRREAGKNALRLFIRDQRTKDRMPVPVRMK